MRSFFSQPDKQGHIKLGLICTMIFGIAAIMAGCPHPLVAGSVLAMVVLAGKEVWDANKPLPADAKRNGWKGHGLDLLADAIGIAAADLLLALVLALST
jgi:hypothetical protein